MKKFYPLTLNCDLLNNIYYTIEKLEGFPLENIEREKIITKNIKVLDEETIKDQYKTLSNFFNKPIKKELPYKKVKEDILTNVVSNIEIIEDTNDLNFKVHIKEIGNHIYENTIFSMICYLNRNNLELKNKKWFGYFSKTNEFLKFGKIDYSEKGKFRNISFEIRKIEKIIKNHGKKGKKRKENCFYPESEIFSSNLKKEQEKLIDQGIDNEKAKRMIKTQYLYDIKRKMSLLKNEINVGKQVAIERTNKDIGYMENMENILKITNKEFFNNYNELNKFGEQWRSKKFKNLIHSYDNLLNNILNNS